MHRRSAFRLDRRAGHAEGPVDEAERDMRAAGRLLAMAAVAALAACAPKPEPRPAPPLVEVVPPPTPPPLPPVETSTDWADLPLSPGDWRYQTAGGGTEAWFGSATEGFMLRCDSGRREVVLTRVGARSGTPLTIRTSSATRAVADGAALPASDPLLDAIAFSRGRFAVEAAQASTLIVPAWPEPGRVVEDCRN
jgi:hypothetical protein